MRLATDVTRCHGDACAVREQCERFRQIGRDEMAPHGSLPPSVRYERTLRSVGAPCQFRIVPEPADAAPRPLDGPTGGFPDAGAGWVAGEVGNVLEGLV